MFSFLFFLSKKEDLTCVLTVLIHLFAQSILACDKPFWSQIRARASSPRAQIVQKKDLACQFTGYDARDTQWKGKGGGGVVWRRCFRQPISSDHQVLLKASRVGMLYPSGSLSLFKSFRRHLCSSNTSSSLEGSSAFIDFKLESFCPFFIGPVCHSNPQNIPVRAPTPTSIQAASEDVS